MLLHFAGVTSGGGYRGSSAGNIPRGSHGFRELVFGGAAYTELGGDEELPLGEEFQELLKRFVRPHEKKVPKRVELIRKLIDQLA